MLIKPVAPFDLLNNVHLLVIVALIPQSCPTLCDPVDCNPPGSSVHGILQARIREWVAFPSPEDPPDQDIEPGSPALQADSLPSELF